MTSIASTFNEWPPSPAPTPTLPHRPNGPHHRIWFVLGAAFGLLTHLAFCVNCANKETSKGKGGGGMSRIFGFVSTALRCDKTRQNKTNKTKQRTAVLCFVLTLNTYTLSCCQPAAPSRCRNVARVRFSLQTGENEKEKRKSSSISKVTRFETFTLNRLAKFWIWFLRHDFPTAGYGLRHGHSRLSESARGFPYLDFLFLLSSLSHLISSPLAPPRLGWTNFVEQNHPKNQQDKTEDGGLSPITRKDPSRPTRDNLLSYRNQPCNPATALYCFLFFPSRPYRCGLTYIISFIHP